MLSLCGKGIAMGNAVEEVKEKADLVIGSNEEDGIAEYLQQRFTHSPHKHVSDTVPQSPPAGRVVGYPWDCGQAYDTVGKNV